MGKHGFVVTCVLTEWLCVVDIPDIKPVVLYFFPSSLPVEMFWNAPPKAHLLNCDIQTNGFHCCSWWPYDPPGFVLPCREGLFEKPSWFNNIFPPKAAKALSCLTPVAPSVELAHNCVYPPSISQSFVMSRPLDTWIQCVRIMAGRQTAWL